MIALHRGNKEAWAPSKPESLALVTGGSFSLGFKSTAKEFAVAIARDVMLTGDFNGDGRTDIVIAQRGDNNVYFLAGQRTGFAAPMQIKLVGKVDARASAGVNSRDGFPKLVAAVSSAQGASVLTFVEGVYASAMSRALAAPVQALAIGKPSADSTGDIVMLSAGRVHIVHGRDAVAASSVAAPMETLSAAFSVRSLTLGEFIWDRSGATQMALLADDGAIHVAAHSDIDTRPFTVDEARAIRLEQQSDSSSKTKRGKTAAAPTWQFVPMAASRVSLAGAGAAPQLLRARLSGQAGDDIVVMDTLNPSIDILTDDGIGGKRSTVNASQAPVAALSMQTSAFVLPSLIVLGQGTARPSVTPSVPLAVFSVTKTADTNDGTCNADCSLREAISAANAALGANTINVPAGTYTLSIGNALGVNENNNATGDLDINNSVTLVGAGAANTIIQAGTTASNGIDKVIAINPICTTAINASISGVTIRFGRNTQPNGAPDFSYTGGSIDVCNTGSGGFTMTSVVVDQNTNTTAYGGGVNFDSAAPANGTNVIIGSTLSGNKTTALVDTNGGGINLYGDAQNVNITNSTISGNTAAGQGGGVFVRHTNGGAITISGTTISGNTAASRGGGVSNGNLLASSLAIVNDSAILNNVSQGTAASFESRGGGIFILTGTGIGTITNDDVAVSITTVTLPNPSVGAAYSQTVAATGGSGPYTFSLSAGALPTGIFLSTGGVLSGTANQVGSFSSTIAATDANSQTASRAYTLNVAAPTLTLTPPAGALTATFGVAYSQTFTAGGSAGPFNYALPGALPGGLSFAGGTLSGPPTAGGSFPITVTATDTLLTGTGAPFAVARNYILTVNALAPGVPTIGAATPGNAQASIAFTAPAANGSAITSYTVTCNPGAITAMGATSPIIVTGLTNGNAYTCSVVATNGVGNGSASATVAVTIPAACTAGAWSASGFTPCAAAAPGYFVATAGAMMQTACLPGNYQPASGQTSCLPAQAGFYATGPAATAQLPCALGTTSAAAASVCARLPLLNIDDSDAPDVYSPSTDGTLLLRYLLGLRGTALTAGATGTNARRNAAQIITHIETYLTLLDVDGDGQTRALTDGVMIVRRMLGLSGSALTSGAKNSARSDDAVRDAIDALKP